MTIIYLSSFPSLRPKPPNDLLRIGGSHDGGYLISKSAVSKSRYLLSFGLSYDIGFENDFVNFDSKPATKVKRSISMFRKIGRKL